MAGNIRIPASEDENKAAPVIAFDVAHYEHMLEDCDWTDAQKREYLETLWSIIVEFVTLGFEIHPVQQAQEAKAACGKVPKKPVKSAKMRADAVEYME